MTKPLLKNKKTIFNFTLSKIKNNLPIEQSEIEKNIYIHLCEHEYIYYQRQIYSTQHGMYLIEKYPVKQDGHF